MSSAGSAAAASAASAAAEPPLSMPLLMRQLSSEAREGHISAEQKTQLQAYLSTSAGAEEVARTAAAAASEDKKQQPTPSGVGALAPEHTAMIPLLRQLSDAVRSGAISDDLRQILKRLILSGTSVFLPHHCIFICALILLLTTVCALNFC
jgi:hypothetical protein